MTIYKKLTYKRLDHKVFLVEWPPSIDENTLEEILALQKILYQNFSQEIRETVPGYHSLAVFLKDKVSYSEILPRIQESIPDADQVKITTDHWELPVCYDKEFGPDLESASKHTGISEQELVCLHQQGTYLVHFIGFLPGFPYLGGMDSRLSMPRKKNPRISVPAGAVGIAGNQTGIYPQNSPGGWNIIGSCPVPLFHPNQCPPCLLKPGDRVHFKAITQEEYRYLRESPAAWDTFKRSNGG